jgi:CheY-like chemotaxis protein
MFEPFFTTKEVGKGTGLGLSTVQGIVAQLGGEIKVESELNVGTTFRILFPVVDEKVTWRGERQESGVPSTGGETVLLVEDDRNVREILAAKLKKANYQVLTASDGLEALKMSGDHAGSITVLVTDVVMPKMNGIQLAKLLRRQRPEVLVIFMSGYTEDMLETYEIDSKNVDLLPKPFNPDVLLEKIRQVIDGR